MKVLVTGSAGRFGRAVVATLVNVGHEVIGVDLLPDRSGLCAASLPADLSDPGEAFDVVTRHRPEAVVHLAAVATPFSRTDTLTYRVNTQAAFNVCHASLQSGVRRVVVASSPTVIGYGAPDRSWRPESLPLDETHPVRPWNAYSLSKAAAEQIVRSFAVASGERAAFAALRPCFVIAPEEWAGAPTQTGHTVRQRLDDPALSGTALFNYLDARDGGEMVRVLLDALPELPNGEVFFAGAADALAREPLAEVVPRVHPELAEWAGTLTGTKPAFSTAKAERLLGWRPGRSWRTELLETSTPDLS
ncbi:NAD(P)-dependent oxidoreductase [Streptomyces bacillaris]|uniref:NAD-dependent epimerase/dehydratase family protein n=1 Tax=Streptomyces TaxID=1883 RepID=UPI0003732B60|nr:MULTISPECIES: NAD(P)-dependent oxidoreductase [unclassified Streptomyces]ALC26529.1 oxidoreductase [Streptomyces sp. CFMR 7]MCR8943178.1 NAD(P)-dependent oxidoreductase [Streptomyces sp. OUCMDZ-4982]MYR38425.1 NAD-dependent epimerase/dehydratase family protein [Streptomyces sp. SID4944]RST25375.1 NAD(P)-dependent oxidoreductase [Streptomyces sp. WAC04770]